MIKVFSQIIIASTTVLRNKKYQIYFLLVVPIIALLLYLIPVYSIPGNSFFFQMQLFKIYDYLLLTILAMLESLLIVMFIYFLVQLRPKSNRMTGLGRGHIGSLSGVPAFLLGTKVCPMCIAAILGVFGPGTVLFALQYRQVIFIASLMVLLLSIYSTSKKINEGCVKCSIL